MSYATPGVYIKERANLPISVAGVSTAVPVFIGMTDKAPQGDEKANPYPIKITSMVEYENHFGTSPAEPTRVTLQADPQNPIHVKLENTGTTKLQMIMYYNLQLFFNNGGSDCYIVSLSDSDSDSADAFIEAITCLETKPDITLLVLTDAAYFLKETAEVYQAALIHCQKMKNRFVIFDAQYSKSAVQPNDEIDQFKAAVGTANLEYAAAYTPFLDTSLNYLLAIDKVNIKCYQTLIDEKLRIRSWGQAKQPELDFLQNNNEFEVKFDSLGLPQNIENISDLLAKWNTVSNKQSFELSSVVSAMPVKTFKRYAMRVAGLNITNNNGFEPKVEIKIKSAGPIKFNLNVNETLEITVAENTDYSVLVQHWKDLLQTDKAKNSGFDLSQSDLPGLPTHVGLDGFSATPLNIVYLDHISGLEYSGIPDQNPTHFNVSKAAGVNQYWSQILSNFSSEDPGLQSNIYLAHFDKNESLDNKKPGMQAYYSPIYHCGLKISAKDIGRALNIEVTLGNEKNELEPENENKIIIKCIDNSSTEELLRAWQVSDAHDIKAKINIEPSEDLRQISYGSREDFQGDKTLTDLKPTQQSLFHKIQAALKKQTKIDNFPPSGAIAGIYASIDNNRGVWQSPANVSLNGVIAPSVDITHKQQEILNIDATTGKSINAIRCFPAKGSLVWGARTLAGNDNNWRYISVKRTFLYVESRVKQALQTFVFESNTTMTWLKVRAMLEPFLEDLWQQGGLAGSTAEDAFFVNIGQGITMTSQDILEGRMKISIGLAAVRPAEFIVVEFSQLLQN